MIHKTRDQLQLELSYYGIGILVSCERLLMEELKFKWLGNFLFSSIMKNWTRHDGVLGFLPFSFKLKFLSKSKFLRCLSPFTFQFKFMIFSF